jgi:hypothetical protein
MTLHGWEDRMWPQDLARAHAPCSTLARRPTNFKSASQIKQKAIEGMSEDCRLSLDLKSSKIFMTSWGNAVHEHMEERGLDAAVFCIFDPVEDSEVCILQDWGKAEPALLQA